MISIRRVSPTAPAFSSGSSEELADLRARFDREHCVWLPGFLDAGLCEEIVDGIRQADFYEREHGHIGTEGCMEPNAILATLLFIANDHRLFEAIRLITGCAAIGCFDGRVYRMQPSSGHHDSWHSDMADHRMVAMSVNLSEERYRGGDLQIRDLRSGDVVHEASNPRRGDALVFRLAEYLRHRVTPVEGPAPRTAFAGWFKSRPTFHSVLRGAGWSA
jgi:2OG-Fe(II) oxygenase superfamily